MTADTPIRRLPFAPRVIVPLSQHIGKPPRAIVRVGAGGGARPADRAADGLAVGAASCAGHRRGRGHRTAARRRAGRGRIHRHPRPCGATQEDLWGRRATSATRQRRTTSCRPSGTPAWSASAAPPFRPTPSCRCPKQAKVHTLVVNGCECEPYLTCDHRVMVEQADDLMRRHPLRHARHRRACAPSSASRTTSRMRSRRCARRSRAGARGDIHVEAVPTKYPQGSEKMLIMALFGVEMPSGELAAVARHGGEQRRHAGGAGPACCRRGRA